VHVHGEEGVVVPEYPQFKELELKDRDLIGGHLSSCAPGICEFSFANLFIWKEFDRPSLTSINGNLCVLIDPLNESPYFLEPLGRENLAETIGLCLEHTGRISRASSKFVSSLPSGFHVHPLRDHFDYVCKAKDLAELRGRRFDGKRNHIKKLLRLHPEYKYEDLKGGHSSEALALFDKWWGLKKKAGPSSRLELSYNSQKRVLENAMHNFDPLGLLGGVIRIGDELAGVIGGSALNKRTMCVHFYYCLTDVPGVATTLLWQACRETFSQYECINMEQDLGLAGLRKSKNSYCPCRLEEKFEISR
jgi:hypothetical protein